MNIWVKIFHFFSFYVGKLKFPQNVVKMDDVSNLKIKKQFAESNNDFFQLSGL